MNIKDFDIELYLNEMAINYKLHGKNIGVNEIGICCPYCSDTSYHLNINIDKKIFHCWRCDIKGNIFNFVSKLENINMSDAFIIIKNRLNKTKTY